LGRSKAEKPRGLIVRKDLRVNCLGAEKTNLNARGGDQRGEKGQGIGTNCMRVSEMSESYDLWSKALLGAEAAGGGDSFWTWPE